MTWRENPLTVEETVEVVRAPRRRTPRAKAAAVTVEQPAVPDSLEQTSDVATQAATETPTIEQPPAIAEVTTAPEAADSQLAGEEAAAGADAASRPELETSLAHGVAVSEFALPATATPSRDEAPAAEPAAEGRGEDGPRPRGRDGRGRRERGPRPAPSERATGA